MNNNISMLKSEAFAIRIVGLYNYLCDEKKEFVLSKQILRAGTSIGANLAEANYAMSKSDFLAKIYISIKGMFRNSILAKIAKRNEVFDTEAI
jgi:four helix bundle protein